MEEKTDLRIRKTYKALCDAFVTILEKKRFDDLTVNELCDEAMIRRAAFHKHFADKYDFFSFLSAKSRISSSHRQKRKLPPTEFMLTRSTLAKGPYSILRSTNH